MDLVAFANTSPRIWLGMLLVLGLVIGSFLNVVIHRLPVMLERRWQQEARFHLGLPVGAPPSRYDLCWPPSSCPHCHQRLRVRDNIPVLSWLWLRGRAHCCGGEVSWRYPLIELLSGGTFLLAGLLWQPGLALLGALLCISMLLALAVIDARTQLLPDVMTLPLLWCGLLFNLADTFVPLEQAVIGAMAGYLSLWLIYWGFRLLSGREALGYGDFKLLAALGAWLGWQALPNLVLIASLTGLVATLLWRRIRRINMQQPLAFGPWLAVSGAIGLVLNVLGGWSH
ncbi:A24 family peptidase [Dickeya zeae]|uniref:prepilin peptidase n=1 Tax=Dickeya zeae TaxID=204042 RepID=UPI001CFC22CE|nr:A24 family peptidase [Dickeya zeae]UCZ74548.1 A24 family peptidase [Dickeya zeae]